MSNKINTNIRFIGNGENREFELSFNILKENNLKIYIDNELQASGYRVIIDRNQKGRVVFDFPPKKDSIVFIIRDLPIKRTTDFKEGGPFRASRVNGEFDYQIYCIEQLEDKLSRTVHKAEYHQNEIDLSLPTPEQGCAIVWNSKENGFENSKIAIDNILLDISMINEKTKINKEYAENVEKSARDVLNKASISLDNLSPKGNEIISSKANIDLDNINSNLDVIVEYFPRTEADFDNWNGSDWYRVWKSGRIEQGGKVSKDYVEHIVNFLVPYTNKDSICLSKMNQIWNTNAMWNKGSAYTDLTNTSVKFTFLNGGCWSATGI